MRKHIKEIIKEAVHLVRNNEGIASRRDILKYIHENYPDVPDGSLLISDYCMNTNSGKHIPEYQKFLFAVARGKYKIFEGKDSFGILKREKKLKPLNERKYYRHHYKTRSLSNFRVKNENLESLANSLKKNYEGYYSKEIRSEMPEYKEFYPIYDSSNSAYAYFFGSMVDQAGISGKIAWRNMNKLYKEDKDILLPENLLREFPEPINCNQKKKKDSNCPAKKFLDKYGLQFPLKHVHTLFKAAHFFKKLESDNRFSMLKIHEFFVNPNILYENLKKDIYSKNTKYPKTLSLAFRVMNENSSGNPEGEERFWKYPAQSLMKIPIPIDFWIAYISFKLELLEPIKKEGLIDVSEQKLHDVLHKIWYKIGEISNIPLIFIDPYLWMVSRKRCRYTHCSHCSMVDIIKYEYPTVNKIYRVSKITESGKKDGYNLFWSDKENLTKEDIPEDYDLELT